MWGALSDERTDLSFTMFMFDTKTDGPTDPRRNMTLTMTCSNMLCCVHPLDERSSILIREKPIFSSERMLHKDNYRKEFSWKISLVVGPKGPEAKTN
jgi:hypothetical protein